MSIGSDRERSRRELVADVLGESAAQERRQLQELLDMELLAVKLYGLASASAHISPAGRALAGRLGQQEVAHASSLARALGLPEPGQPPQANSALESALSSHGISVSLLSLRAERQWFTLLERLEGALEGAYYKALKHLSDPGHATLAARILASEAQHSTLLFSFRNPQDVELAVAVGLVRGNATQSS